MLTRKSSNEILISMSPGVCVVYIVYSSSWSVYLPQVSIYLSTNQDIRDVDHKDKYTDHCVRLQNMVNVSSFEIMNL